jgi:hypothetical protein
MRAIAAMFNPYRAHGALLQVEIARLLMPVFTYS